MSVKQFDIISRILLTIVDLLLDEEMIMSIRRFQISKSNRHMIDAIKRIKFLGYDKALELVKELAYSAFNIIVNILTQKRKENLC